MSALATLLDALDRDTRALREAARAGELAACGPLLARRAETLAALSRLRATPGVDPAALARAAERALESDAALAQELGARRHGLRVDLEAVQQARRGVRRAAAPENEARFVCERV